MSSRRSKKENLEETVKSGEESNSDEIYDEVPEKSMFLSEKAHLVDLQDKLKEEIVNIIAEMEKLETPAIRQSLNVNQEDLELFLKSKLKISDDTPLKDIETTHFTEFESFLDDLGKEVLCLENYLKRIQTDIKYYVEQNQIFRSREQSFDSVSEERVKKLKVEKRQYVNNLAEVKKSMVQYKKKLEEVVDVVFESNIETARSLLRALWDALKDGDKYVDISPEHEELIASLHLVSLIKYHPHDLTKIKLQSDL